MTDFEIVRHVVQRNISNAATSVQTGSHIRSDPVNASQYAIISEREDPADQGPPEIDIRDVTVIESKDLHQTKCGTVGCNKWLDLLHIDGRLLCSRCAKVPQVRNISSFTEAMQTLKDNKGYKRLSDVKELPDKSTAEEKLIELLQMAIGSIGKLCIEEQRYRVQLGGRLHFSEEAYKKFTAVGFPIRAHDGKIVFKGDAD